MTSAFLPNKSLRTQLNYLSLSDQVAVVLHTMYLVTGASKFLNFYL